MGLNPGHRVYVAGHRGMVGSAMVRALRARGFDDLVLAGRDVLDLLDQRAVYAFLEARRPDCVVVAAARVGGIHANDTRRAEFIHDNLVIESNLIHGAWRAGVRHLLFLGSSCIYPRDCAQPIREDALLTGPLEPTNEPYAIAKIAGIKLCEAYNAQYGTHYVSVMPTNLYGPNDNYDPQSSHVLPALMRKAHEARLNGASTIPVWGSGRPRREFLHVDDLAQACLHLLTIGYAGGLVNIGCGEDISIRELAERICAAVGVAAQPVFDASMPDGTPRKLLDIGRIRALGWEPAISLDEGLRRTYQSFLGEQSTGR